MAIAQMAADVHEVNVDPTGVLAQTGRLRQFCSRHDLARVASQGLQNCRFAGVEGVGR